MDYLDYDVDLTWLENIMAADILALNSWEDNCCRCWLDFTWHTDYWLSWQLCWLDLKTLMLQMLQERGMVADVVALD